MAGHSQFKNIMHRKGRQDAVKSKLFGKLAREITVSAKLGLPDPDMNARLRAAIIAARAENMPKDNIDRAIKKAMGAEGIVVDRLEDVGPALKRAIDMQMNQGKTTIVEIMCTRELGDPFRRDALSKPVRMLDKYKDFV